MTFKQIITGVVYFLVFVISAGYDLNISLWMTSDPPVWLKEIGIHVGCIAGVLVLTFCFAYLASRFRARKWLVALPFIPAVIAGHYIVYLSSVAGYLATVIVGIIIALIMFKLTERADMRSKAALNAAVMGIVFVIGGVILNNVLKCLWGRPRFYTLADPETDFVPWYVINGPVLFDDGLKSFPSGHTTNAAFIIWIFNLKYFCPERNFNKIVLGAVACLWIVMTALSRIAAGMHFLSDTVGATGITLLLYVCLSNRFMIDKADAKTPPEDLR